MKLTRRQGFTLLELSIVLVIIGLVIGGVTVGSQLIRQAEFNSALSESRNFETAISTFKLKYGQLPGDFSRATQYWGAAHATPATCRDTQGTGTQTCNGDGNGTIITAPGFPATAYEMFRTWQHLSNAGMVPGNFTGVQGPTGGWGWHHVINTNCPKAKIAGTGWSIFHATDAFTTVALHGIDGHILTLGMESAGDETVTPFLLPSELKGIDLKADDGLPGSGKIRGVRNVTGKECRTADNSDYDVDHAIPTCNLMVKLGI